MFWYDLLRTCGIEQTFSRSQSVLGRRTIYKLGKGGFYPTKPFTTECDCSGFIAWAIGIPREFPPGSNKWLSTDEYWAGGKPVKAGLFTQVKMSEAKVGDLLVYPDGGGRQGHISLILQVDNNMPTYIIHCSLGNYKNFGDAIRITTPAVFLTGNHDTRVMQINYALLKSFIPITI